MSNAIAANRRATWGSMHSGSDAVTTARLLWLLPQLA